MAHFVRLVSPNRQTVETVKVGWSWTVFFFAPFWGIPLWKRGLIGQALLMVLIGVLEIFMLFNGGFVFAATYLFFLWPLSIVLAIIFAVGANRNYARNLLASGWKFEKGQNSEVVRHAAFTWNIGEQQQLDVAEPLTGIELRRAVYKDPIQQAIANNAETLRRMEPVPIVEQPEINVSRQPPARVSSRYVTSFLVLAAAVVGGLWLFNANSPSDFASPAQPATVARLRNFYIGMTRHQFDQALSSVLLRSRRDDGDTVRFEVLGDDCLQSQAYFNDEPVRAEQKLYDLNVERCFMRGMLLTDWDNGAKWLKTFMAKFLADERDMWCRDKETESSTINNKDMPIPSHGDCSFHLATGEWISVRMTADEVWSLRIEKGADIQFGFIPLGNNWNELLGMDFSKYTVKHDEFAIKGGAPDAPTGKSLTLMSKTIPRCSILRFYSGSDDKGSFVSSAHVRYCGWKKVFRNAVEETKANNNSKDGFPCTTDKNRELCVGQFEEHGFHYWITIEGRGGFLNSTIYSRSKPSTF